MVKEKNVCGGGGGAVVGERVHTPKCSCPKGDKMLKGGDSECIQVFTVHLIFYRFKNFLT